MVDGTYAITGLPRPADAVTKTKKIPYVTNLPLRYEISAFASSKDKETRKQWTLYVLALERFKTKPVDEKLSYFQVAGIVSDTSNKCMLGSLLIHRHSTDTQRLFGTMLPHPSRIPSASSPLELSRLEGIVTTMVSTSQTGTDPTCCSSRYVTHHCLPLGRG